MVLGINPQDKFAALFANAETQGGNKTISPDSPYSRIAGQPHGLHNWMYGWLL